MFTGVNFEQAIDYWKKGREVIVIDRNSRTVSGGYDNFPFEELFRNVELLADVPAIENPDFNNAVTNMISGGSDQGQPAEEKSSTPPSAGPEVNKALPAGKSKKAIILDLASQGMNASEIAKKTGIKYNTVYAHLNPDKCKKKVQHKPGWNTDRHACRNCKYRAGGPRSGCDYYVITDQERGCDPADCDKYEKGNRYGKEDK